MTPTLAGSVPETPTPFEEQRFELLRFLVLRSRGGRNRGRILVLLWECPRNTHEIARELALNYGTVALHLRTLLKASLVVPLTQDRYAQAFAIAPTLRRTPNVFDALRAKAAAP